MLRISTAEFIQRRQVLMQQMQPNSLAIIASSTELTRNGDAHFAFRQNSHFCYLTGFNEPEAVAILIPGREDGEYLLFNRERDRDAEIWNGRRAGQEGAVVDFAADEAFAIDEIDEVLPELLKGIDNIYCNLGQDYALDETLLECVNSLRRKARAGQDAPQQIIHLETLLNAMRLIKSDEEIAIMREAGQITADAHARAIQMAKPGMHEYQLEAEITHEFMIHGCRHHAYTPIVAGGDNACILHYTDNDQAINDGDLVLIDAGAEYQNYAADVTRTFPINGRFSEEQRAIYQIVLDAQLAGIAEVKPGNSWGKIQQTMVRVITEGLVSLNILQGNIDDLVVDKAYQDFYMHNSGHWLGLDVHDVGDYKIDGQWRPLAAGMVLTVEPGIYIGIDQDNVDAKWRGIGVRIEDDVLLTTTGHDILTDAVPKTIADIEAMMTS